MDKLEYLKDMVFVSAKNFVTSCNEGREDGKGFAILEYAIEQFEEEMSLRLRRTPPVKKFVQLFECPHCGSKRLSIERRIDGDTTCLDCGKKWKSNYGGEI